MAPFVPINEIVKSTTIGDQKTGDLTGVRVFEFRMANQLTLLAYVHDANDDTLNLIDFGSHENFYRDLKKQ